MSENLSKQTYKPQEELTKVASEVREKSNELLRSLLEARKDATSFCPTEELSDTINEIAGLQRLLLLVISRASRIMMAERKGGED